MWAYRRGGHAYRTFKYADDFTLLVPENTDVSAESDIANIITSWSLMVEDQQTQH